MLGIDSFERYPSRMPALLSEVFEDVGNATSKSKSWCLTTHTVGIEQPDMPDIIRSQRKRASIINTPHRGG
jgi:hypothetical protein